MTITGFLIMIVVLLLFAGSWYVLSYLMTPHMANPDGYAKVTGSCGDTMEIGLKIEEGVVVRTHCWTDGCSLSRQCLESAARLAQNQRLDDLGQVDLTRILDEVGKLPDTHMHCAQLAEITLAKAAAGIHGRGERSHHGSPGK